MKKKEEEVCTKMAKEVEPEILDRRNQFATKMSNRPMLQLKRRLDL